MIGTFWAQTKLSELALAPPTPVIKEEILQLGREFSLVTEFTSFIVLETLDQYLKHKILPPLGLPKIRQKYEALMQLQNSKGKIIREDKILQVLDFWSRLVLHYFSQP